MLARECNSVGEDFTLRIRACSVLPPKIFPFTRVPGSQWRTRGKERVSDQRCLWLWLNNMETLKQGRQILATRLDGPRTTKHVHLLMIGKTKRKISESFMICEHHIAASINKTVLEHSPTRVFCQNTCDRRGVWLQRKPQVFTVWPFIEKVCWPPLKLSLFIKRAYMYLLIYWVLPVYLSHVLTHLILIISLGHVLL